MEEPVRVLRCDFHARSRSARSTIPEEKWGTTRSLVQKVNSAIHQINLYPQDSAIFFPNTYPQDSYSVIRWIALSNF